jgi:hypothetical protein
VRATVAVTVELTVTELTVTVEVTVIANVTK